MVETAKGYIVWMAHSNRDQNAQAGVVNHGGWATCHLERGKMCKLFFTTRDKPR